MWASTGVAPVALARAAASTGASDGAGGRAGAKAGAGAAAPVEQGRLARCWTALAERRPEQGGGCHWTGAALEQGRRPLLEQGPEQERAGRRVESRRWAAPFALGEPRQAPEARNRANEQRLRADKVAEEPITKNRVLPKNRRLLTIQRSIGRKSP